MLCAGFWWFLFLKMQFSGSSLLKLKSENGKLNNAARYRLPFCFLSQISVHFILFWIFCFWLVSLFNLWLLFTIILVYIYFHHTVILVYFKQNLGRGVHGPTPSLPVVKQRECNERGVLLSRKESSSVTRQSSDSDRLPNKWSLPLWYHRKQAWNSPKCLKSDCLEIARTCKSC